MPKILAGHCAIRNWDTIYVIGSASNFLEVFAFNITTSNWKTFTSLGKLLPENPTARRDFACSMNADKTSIYVSGGKLSFDPVVTTNDFFSYNISTQSWSKLPSSKQPRSGHIITLYRDFPTVVGGVDDDNQSLMSLESFNGTDWVQLHETLSNGRKNFGVAAVPTYLLPSVL